MSTELHASLREAEDASRNPLVAALGAVGSKSVIHAAWVLSSTLAIDAQDLAGLVEQLWPETEDGAGAVEELLEWPFVEWTSDGSRMSDASANAFREEFMIADPGRFKRCHEILAIRESHQESDAEDDDRWFIRGRVAFYLAGFDGGESVRLFTENFSEPPSLDRTDARMWLSWLAIHQEQLLRDQGRAITFFRGFRAYVSGARSLARESFDEILAGDQEDDYQALAGHFSGILRRSQDLDLALTLFQQSVQLSADLGLKENEVMARNSQATLLIARGKGSDYQDAEALGRLNLERAGLTEDHFLINWCRATAAVTRWLALTDDRSNIGEDAIASAGELVVELLSVRDDCIDEDLETALYAANDAACICRDLGQYDEALQIIGDTVSRIPTHLFVTPQAPMKGLAKTAGSMFKKATPRQKVLIQHTLDDLDARLGSGAD